MFKLLLDKAIKGGYDAVQKFNDGYNKSDILLDVTFWKALFNNLTN